MLEQVGDHRVEQVDLPGQPADQLPQRGDLPRVRLRQAQAVQPRAVPGTEDVGAGDRHAELGQHRVHLVLAASAQAHQLDPVPRELPQLADLSRGDPRLGQPAHPQQIGKISRVFLVVLDPAVAERPDRDQGRLAPPRRGPHRQGGDPPGNLTPLPGRTRGHQPGKLVAASPEETRPPNQIS
jgi:hypothetical protein